MRRVVQKQVDQSTCYMHYNAWSQLDELATETGAEEAGRKQVIRIVLCGSVTTYYGPFLVYVYCSLTGGSNDPTMLHVSMLGEQFICYS